MNKILYKGLIFGQWPSPETYKGNLVHTEFLVFVLTELKAFSQAINEKNDDFSGKNWICNLLQAPYCRYMNNKIVRALALEIGQISMKSEGLTSHCRVRK